MTDSVGHAGLHHLDLNVADLPRSVAFYEEVLGRLGYREVERGTGWISFGDGMFYITLVQIEERFAVRGFHRKAIGVNHLAFPAPSVKAVDDFHVWVMARGVPTLYGSPLDMGHPDSPNYAVFLEDPDRLKLEYVYRPG